MIRIVINSGGVIQAVEDDARRGVVRAPVSLARFVKAVNEEFPELKLEVHRG